MLVRSWNILVLGLRLFCVLIVLNLKAHIEGNDGKDSGYFSRHGEA